VFIDNTADTATAMIPLRARFSNEREVLWPGETVGVTLTLAMLTNAVVVPSAAVHGGMAGRYVLVVRPDLVVERRPVVIYNRVAGETIIKSGIDAGERLITYGQEGVLLGKQIKVPSEADGT
jgi:multidrug efflux system membrane fusion protein